MGWGTPKICSPSGSQRSFPQYMKISQYGSLNRHKGTAEQERGRCENQEMRANLSPAER